MTGINKVLQLTWGIANTVADPKTKLQALYLINDCYKYIMDLTTNGVVVTDAIKFVQNKLDYLNTAEKELLQDIKQNEEEGKESEQKTNNSIF
jgi:prefoldin subunit 5